MNRKIYINPMINFKLSTLDITKVGHLVYNSYSELYYSGRFNREELDIIQNYLINLNLNFIDEMDINQRGILKEEMIKFIVDEYQNKLKYYHMSDEEVEPLKYSDNIDVVKYLFYLYKEFNPDITLFPDKKILLNRFLKAHKGMTIGDFIDINNEFDKANISLISDILGLPLNEDLKVTDYEAYIKREEDVFAGNVVSSKQIDLYESLRDKKLIYKIK